MVVDVKLCRAPGQPFGFRLIGGRDFEIPLTVSRVIESSIAQASGLQEGDVVVRINDDPTMEMTHEDAHIKLLAAGDSFVLGVLRATNVLEEAAAHQEASVASQDDVENQNEIDKIIPDKPVTDEEIAELLSGEAELLKEHGVLGVNFNRMMPKSGVFKNSEVFQVLNDEQLKAKAQAEHEEHQRWTTFLQKPNRPPPTPKGFQEMQNTYKPMIVKQPKPKCAPDFRLTPSPQPVQFHEFQNVQTQESEDRVEENCHHEEQQEIITQEQEIIVAEVSSESVVTTTTETSTTTITEKVTTFEEIAAEAIGEVANDELVAEEIKSQEDEMSIVSSAFAEQLENVQSQLMALSHLPRTIQSTLDEITKQLQSLIPTKSKQKSAEPESNTKNEEKVVTNEEVKVTALETVEQQSAMEVQKCEVTITTVEETINQEETVVTQQEMEDEHHPTNDEIEEYEESQKKFRELWEKKREKEPDDVKTELSAELKQKVTEDRTIKQKKAKNFRGLQPQERPIILPGGRKWKNAKDAMNDELIAEIISSQAELIMGSTLGYDKYESPVLHFDDRVNFLKYQKPEKDLSFLKNSETYRTIHHLTPHENGIEKRPAMVAAEEDVLKCTSPHPLNQIS